MDQLSTPGSALWCGEWVCPHEDPKHVVKQEMPLHNPVYCRGHRINMVPKPGTKMSRIAPSKR